MIITIASVVVATIGLALLVAAAYTTYPRAENETPEERGKERGWSSVKFHVNYHEYEGIAKVLEEMPGWVERRCADSIETEKIAYGLGNENRAREERAFRAELVRSADIVAGRLRAVSDGESGVVP